ncbi:hypothetical protein [Okeania sp. SIO1I7]|nr:hypothetical protein [Okeania sp. SIO1I7]NET25679.1 hypothetical protein [Okeania sp. SIO1I7]
MDRRIRRVGVGRWGDGEMGSVGDGEMGRWGVWEVWEVPGERESRNNN